MKTRTITLLLTVMLIIAILSTVACSSQGTQEQSQAGNASDQISNSSGVDIGQGATMFIFEVIDDNDDKTIWNVHTDDATVGAALLDVGLIEGAMFDFGLMVSHVNGIRADFVEDGAYWAFYIDGEMAMAGVDTTDIEEGVTYSFIYTEA